MAAPALTIEEIQELAARFGVTGDDVAKADAAARKRALESALCDLVWRRSLPEIHVDAQQPAEELADPDEPGKPTPDEIQKSLEAGLAGGKD